MASEDKTPKWDLESFIETVESVLSGDGNITYAIGDLVAALKMAGQQIEALTKRVAELERYNERREDYEAEQREYD